MALPNETLTAIFLQLPPATLVQCTQVSTRFNAVAERVLYAAVSINDVLAPNSPLPFRTLSWCEAVRRRPYLVDAARRVHVRWTAAPATPPSPYLSSACDVLAASLRMLPLLDALDLFLGSANLVPGPPHLPPLHATERALRGCRFPHLRALALGADASPKGASAPYTPALAAFLSLHPSLRVLRLADLHIAPPGGVPATALPHLALFRGSADAAAALLPGRPVRYLALVGDDDAVTRENLPRIAGTLGALRTLDLSAMSARPVLLRNVSTHLPALEGLRVKLALRHTLHYSFSGIRILAGLSSVLRAFPRLSFLDLSPTGVDGVGRAAPLEELALCVEWARACPSLRRVVFPSSTEWLLDASAAGEWVLASHAPAQTLALTLVPALALTAE